MGAVVSFRIVRDVIMICVLGVIGFFQSVAGGESTPPPVTEVVQTVRAVLTEAETLGLPSLTNATLFEGDLPQPGFQPWQQANSRLYRHVHARLPDGSWLIDLIVPMPASRLARGRIAALKPFVPGSPPEKPQRGKRQLSPDELVLLAEARRCAIGVPEVADFPPIWFDYRRMEFYPRIDRAKNVGDTVRLACRDRFLALGQGDAAVAIAPERWRAATRRMANRASLPDPLPTGPIGLVAGFPKPEWSEAPGVDVPLLPEVDDATLITLVGNHSPATVCCTVGESALYLLSQRWGFDPAVLAGRDVEAPLDDAEQDAIAVGLAAWWQRTTGQTMQQRWLAALRDVSPSSALLSLSKRADGMDSRRWFVKDRLQHHTWRGTKPPELPPEDDKQLLDGLLDTILGRWEQTPGVIPAEMDPGLWRMIMGHVDGSVAFQGQPPSDLDQLQIQAKSRAKRFAAIVAPWPRTGPMADDLLVWDDAHQQPAGLEARVEATLAKPDLTRAEAQAALRLWLSRGTAARWKRIESLLARDSQDVAWQALVLLMIEQRLDFTVYSATDLRPLVAWQLLHDERMLPAMVLAQELPRRVDTRISVLVAGYLASSFEIHRLLTKLQINGTRGVSLDALFRPDAPRSEQDAAMVTLRSVYSPQVASLCTSFSLPLPTGCEVPVQKPQQPIEVTPTISPDLTTEEAAEIRAVLAEAVSLGFPDLTGAKAVSGEFPGGKSKWWGVHLRLANGSWLAEEVLPALAPKLETEPVWLDPVPGTILQNNNQLPPVARGRVSVDVAVGDLVRCYGDSVLPALAWWLSGSDKTGKTVVGTVYNEAVLRHDVGDIWTIASGRGGADRGELHVVPSIADGVRRSVARWFRHQVVWAKNGTEADQAIAAAKRILPSADLPTWEPMLSALRARLELPDQEPAGADLATRLQSWKSTDKDAQGAGTPSRKVPAKRTDTAALVALLDDPRPTRWVEHYALPRPVGDAALEALGELWGFDWRWLVVTDPAVAAVLPPRRDQMTREVDRGDEWLWGQTAWTAERRAVIMPAIKAWWQGRGPTASSPLHDVFRTVPLPLWDDIFGNLSAAEAGDAALGDILAERLRTITPPKPDAGMEQYTVGVVLKIATRQPRHAGLAAVIASWPQLPWLEAVAALRAEYAGDSAGFDRWMQEALDQQVPSSEDRDPASPGVLVGIWAHHPSPLRLAALRRILSGDLDDPRLPWLVSLLGNYCWLGNWTLLPGGHGEITSSKAQAIPDALAMDGLKDQRVLTPAVRRAFINSIHSYDRNLMAKRLPADVRICDWTAFQMLNHSSVLGPEGKHVANEDAFFASDRSKRDAVITALIEKLTPKLEENLEAAKLIPETPIPTGATGF